MPHEVFDTDKKEWITVSDAELATFRVVTAPRYSESTIDRDKLRALVADEKRMTNDEIDNAAMSERIAILEQMWENIGKSPEESEKRMSNYLRMLNFIPSGLLSLAVDRAMIDNGKFLTVPTPGAIVDALEIILGKPYDLRQEIRRWNEILWNQAVYLNSKDKTPSDQVLEPVEEYA